MTDMTFVVEKQFLVSLANRIFKHGRGRIAFRSPLVQPQLLAVDPDFRAASVVQREAFRDARRAIVGHDDVADREMPTWSDFTQAIQACGAVPPRNFPEFLESLGRIEGDSGRAKSPAIAIDSNVAYNRLFSRHLDHVFDTSGAFRVLVSRGVRGEIDSRIRDKVSREELSRLYSSQPLAPYLDQLGNRNGLGTRKAKLAQNEVDYLTARHSPIEAPCGAFEGDKEAFDREISKGYATSAEQQRLDAYMVTFDQNMINHAKNAGLRSLGLVLPEAERIKGASLERSLPALVHDLAVIFGVIVVEPFDICVWGEWSGKTSDDYASERLRIEMDSDSPIMKAFARDVDLGQRLLEESARWA